MLDYNKNTEKLVGSVVKLCQNIHVQQSNIVDVFGTALNIYYSSTMNVVSLGKLNSVKGSKSIIFVPMSESLSREGKSHFLKVLTM